MNGPLIDCDNNEAYALFMRLFDENDFRFAPLRESLGKYAHAT